MDVLIKGRKIDCNWLQLGVQGDNKAEEIRFVLPRPFELLYENADSWMYFILFELQDGTTGSIYIPNNDIIVSGENIILTWIVGSEVTQHPGRMSIALKISGLNDEVWHSEIAQCTVSKTIQIESPQPVMFAFNGLEPKSPLLRSANPENEPPITISERTINIPTELYNIAVQNDENSEQVRIILPRFFDGNDLSKYLITLKCISEDGGRSDVAFLNPSISNNDITLYWILKPPQTSYAGKLSIQLHVEGTKSDGSRFEWETFGDNSVNIKESLDASPVIPTNPSIMDSFLKEIAEVAQQVKGSKEAAEKSASDAKQSANDASIYASKAAQSATNAKSSEENAKKSETSAAGSLTDINTGLAGKLPIADANNFFKDVELNEKTGVFTFTRYDGTTLILDTRLEQVVVNFSLDAETMELVLRLADGTEQRISIASFMNVYLGGNTATVQVQIQENQITASVKGNSIGLNLLTPQLQENINKKINASESGNANQVLFTDGQSMQEKLDSGALNGKDGVVVESKGLFYMRVDEFGHLKVGVADGSEQPPFYKREDGHLIYLLE